MKHSKGLLQAMELFIVRFVQMCCTRLEHNDLYIDCLLKLPLHESYYHPVYCLKFFRTLTFQEHEKEHKRVQERLCRKSEDACCAEGVSTSCVMVRKKTITNVWLQRSIGKINLSISNMLALNLELSQGNFSSNYAKMWFSTNGCAYC